jgi:hypothetical protein
MKNKIALLCIIAFAIVHSTFASKDTVSIQKAFESKLIKLDIKGAAGYQGPCIAMQIKNEDNQPMVLYVEAGRRLDSKDSTQQDILVVQDLFVSLMPKQERSVKVTGYCCQATNHAPASKSVFSVGELAENKLYDLARYLNQAKLEAGSIQNSVWCISNDHELSSIVDDGTAEVSKLRRFLAELKGIVLPWYSIFYKKKKDVLFSGDPEKVVGRIEYYINDYSQVIANVRDEKGIIVKTFPIGNKVERGSYVFNMDWDVTKIPRSFFTKYSVAIYQNGRELKKLYVDLK